MPMCKKGIAASVKNQDGRILNIRVQKEKNKSNLVCTFIGRGCTSGNTVHLSEVEPANKKAGKKLVEELKKFSSTIAKPARVGVQLSPA